MSYMTNPDFGDYPTRENPYLLIERRNTVFNSFKILKTASVTSCLLPWMLFSTIHVPHPSRALVKDGLPGAYASGLIVAAAGPGRQFVLIFAKYSCDKSYGLQDIIFQASNNYSNCLCCPAKYYSYVFPEL